MGTQLHSRENPKLFGTAVRLNITGRTMLQRKCACGNHTVAGAECNECGKRRRLPLQTKLAVSEPSDIHEQEADEIAARILSAPLQTNVSNTPLRIQRFTGQPAGQAEAVPESVDRVLESPGRPLEPRLRQDMEQRFGHDFSGVRVHHEAPAEQSARELNANAYTVGQNIVFGAGWFAPATHEGRRLIAHELTHVVQQSYPSIGSRRYLQRQMTTQSRQEYLEEWERARREGLFDQDPRAWQARVDRQRQAVIHAPGTRVEGREFHLYRDIRRELEIMRSSLTGSGMLSFGVRGVRTGVEYQTLLSRAEAVGSLEQAMGGAAMGRGAGTRAARETIEFNRPPAEWATAPTSSSSSQRPPTPTSSSSSQRPPTPTSSSSSQIPPSSSTLTPPTPSSTVISPTSQSRTATYLINRYGQRLGGSLQEMLRRASDPNIPVHRRAAAHEIEAMIRYLERGAPDGRVVSRIDAIPSSSGARSPDFVASFTDGTQGRIEITAVTSGPRGTLSTGAGAPIAQAERLAHRSAQRATGISASDIGNAIERKALGNSQLLVPMAGVPVGGTIVVHVTHGTISATVADAAIARVVQRQSLGPHVHSVEIVFSQRDASGALRRTVRAYRRAPDGSYPLIE